LVFGVFSEHALIILNFCVFRKSKVTFLLWSH
jgi:hypothetical protein